MNTATGPVSRVADGFSHPLVVLSDGANRLLIADYFVANTSGGAIYALTAMPSVSH